MAALQALPTQGRSERRQVLCEPSLHGLRFKTGRVLPRVLWLVHAAIVVPRVETRELAVTLLWLSGSAIYWFGTNAGANPRRLRSLSLCLAKGTSRQRSPAGERGTQVRGFNRIAREKITRSCCLRQVERVNFKFNVITGFLAGSKSWYSAAFN